MGDAAVTGGSAAHGDFVGVAVEFFAFNEGFSEDDPPAAAPLCCLACCAAIPGFNMVLGGPLSLGFFTAKPGLAFSAGFEGCGVDGFGSCAGGSSAGVNVDFVPSIHTTASGAQSSSSSSMSAHFDSLLFSSDCNRVAK